MVRTGIPVSVLENEGEDVILTVIDLLAPESTSSRRVEEL